MNIQMISTISGCISSLAAVASASAIWFLWKQVKLHKDQINEEHEKARREMSVNLLLEWSKSLNQQSSAARKIVETLDKEQALCLSKQELFKLNKKYKELLHASLSCSPDCIKTCKAENDYVELKQHCVTNLRWQIICYLNTLEFIFSAWRHNIADRTIIEEQFEYLINDKEGHQLVHNFRTAVGGSEAYPALEEFANHIKEKRNSPQGLDKTGNIT